MTERRLPEGLTPLPDEIVRRRTEALNQADGARDVEFRPGHNLVVPLPRLRAAIAKMKRKGHHHRYVAISKANERIDDLLRTGLNPKSIVPLAQQVSIWYAGEILAGRAPKLENLPK